MGFTTQTFLFVFFPICMGVYYLSMLLQTKGVFAELFKKCRLNDLVLIGISAGFYLWACFDDVFRFAAYILMVYLLGEAIQKIRSRKICLHVTCGEEKRQLPVALLVLFLAVAGVVFLLVHYKYTGLLADIWNLLTKDTLTGKTILAPLGISFITFSAISYLADIYMGKATAGNLVDCALYLSFFPKVISGPIVLWRDFKTQTAQRQVTLELLSDGVTRIMGGFAKKLILADTLGACVASASGAVDVPTAWGVSLLYMLQIYFDFSGYSDIAIGLSNMLGFSFRENFNFPYLSCSITEFWRRWHISLGTWFREYIYFPLGGSRHGKRRTIINIAVVFVLTGIWHGAGWTYMLWGIVNGVCNILEKLVADKKWYLKTPRGVKWFVTMGITFFCWELFRFESGWACFTWFKTMFGWMEFASIPYSWRHYFDTRIIVLAVIAVLGATVAGLPRVQRAGKALIQKPWGYVLCQIVHIILFVVSILFMVNSTYSPFIYFQY